MPDSHRALAGLAILSIVVSVGACLYTGSVGVPLRQPHSPAPRGGLSLQLPPNDAQARAIVEYLVVHARPRQPRAAAVRRRQGRDRRRLLVHSQLRRRLAVEPRVGCPEHQLTAAATAARKVSRPVAGAVAAVVVIAALCDLVENRLMTFQLILSQPLVPGVSASWNAHLASLVDREPRGSAERPR